jgi:putative transposase
MDQDKHVYKKHSKTLLLYHIVCPIKYRKKVLDDKRGETLKEICKGIEERYEIEFIEIGVDEDHVHFLIKSVPILSVCNIVKTIKGITGREMYKRHRELKKELWGGNFWTSGYYVNTVGQYGNFDVIKRYVQKQGGKYEQLYADERQLALFEK